MITAALADPGGLIRELQARVSRDSWVWIVVIAIALVLAVGLLVAWWMVCQAQGGYPAVDMPSWETGGTWKVYCRA